MKYLYNATVPPLPLDDNLCDNNLMNESLVQLPDNGEHLDEYIGTQQQNIRTIFHSK